MGVGASYGTRKGFIASGTTAYVTGNIVTVTGDATVALALATNDLLAFGVVMEDMTAIRLIAAPGKIIVNVGLEGIVRVTTGAAVAIGDRVTNDVTARAVTRVRAIAGAQPLPVLGIAMTVATAAGQQIDVLLTPGAGF